VSPTTFKGGPKEEISVQEAQKQESKLTSSLGSRGMSTEQMMGRPELKALLSGMKGSIGSAVRGFLGRLTGKKA
jgi:hypothetical protein